WTARCPHLAVVDEDRVAVLQGGREPIDERERADRDNELLRVTDASKSDELLVKRSRRFDEPISVQPDADFPPAADHAERQVVEQLVRDDDVDRRLELGVNPFWAQKLLEPDPSAGPDLDAVVLDGKL